MNVIPTYDLCLIRYLERESLKLIQTAPVEAVRLAWMAALIREAAQ